MHQSAETLIFNRRLAITNYKKKLKFTDFIGAPKNQKSFKKTLKKTKDILDLGAKCKIIFWTLKEIGQYFRDESKMNKYSRKNLNTPF